MALVAKNSGLSKNGLAVYDGMVDDIQKRVDWYGRKVWFMSKSIASEMEMDQMEEDGGEEGHEGGTSVEDIEHGSDNDNGDRRILGYERWGVKCLSVSVGAREDVEDEDSPAEQACIGFSSHSMRSATRARAGRMAKRQKHRAGAFDRDVVILVEQAMRGCGLLACNGTGV